MTTNLTENPTAATLVDGPVCSRTLCDEPAFMKTDDQHVCPAHADDADDDGDWFAAAPPMPLDVDTDTTPETMPAATGPADLPLTALVDVVDAAIESCNTLLEALPSLRHRYPIGADTTEYDMQVKRMYLTAEDRTNEAFRALITASQLVRGLAR